MLLLPSTCSRGHLLSTAYFRELYENVQKGREEWKHVFSRCPEIPQCCRIVLMTSTRPDRQVQIRAARRQHARTCFGQEKKGWLGLFHEAYYGKFIQDSILDQTCIAPASIIDHHRHTSTTDERPLENMDEDKTSVQESIPAKPLVQKRPRGRKPGSGKLVPANSSTLTRNGTLANTSTFAEIISAETTTSSETAPANISTMQSPFSIQPNHSSRPFSRLLKKQPNIQLKMDVDEHVHNTMGFPSPSKQASKQAKQDSLSPTTSSQLQSPQTLPHSSFEILSRETLPRQTLSRQTLSIKQKKAKSLSLDTNMLHHSLNTLVSVPQESLQKLEELKKSRALASPLHLLEQQSLCLPTEESRTKEQEEVAPSSHSSQHQPPIPTFFSSPVLKKRGPGRPRKDSLLAHISKEQQKTSYKILSSALTRADDDRNTECLYTTSLAHLLYTIDEQASLMPFLLTDYNRKPRLQMKYDIQIQSPYSDSTSLISLQKNTRQHSFALRLPCSPSKCATHLVFSSFPSPESEAQEQISLPLPLLEHSEILLSEAESLACLLSFRCTIANNQQAESEEHHRQLEQLEKHIQLQLMDLFVIIQQPPSSHKKTSPPILASEWLAKETALDTEESQWVWERFRATRHGKPWRISLSRLYKLKQMLSTTPSSQYLPASASTDSTMTNLTIPVSAECL